MCEPASCEYSFDETIGQIESHLKMALENAKTMDKNKSVWHPNSTPGVSVSLSNETMRLIDSAIRELWRLKDRERNEEMEITPELEEKAKWFWEHSSEEAKTIACNELLSGTKPEDAIAFGECVDNAMCDLIAAEVEAEMDRRMIEERVKRRLAKKGMI